MLNYVLHRVLALVPTLLVVSVVVFGLQQMLPGDVAQAMAGEDQDPQVIAQIRRTYRLDEPFPVRYALWLGGVVRGDLGISLRNQVPVSELIGQKLPATMLLATMAMAWAFAIGIPAGVLAALRKGSAVDHLANVVGLAGLSVPPFWLGLMLILLVSVNLGLLPASGYVSPFVSPGDALRSLVMPSFVLGASAAAVLMRHTRTAMLAALRSDYVRTARAKGLYERLVILRHAFRNALIPIITMAALQTGQLLSGAVLTEQVFTIPGFGRLIVDGVFTRDYAVVQGAVLVTALIYVMINLAADIAYGLADPKMRKA